MYEHCYNTGNLITPDKVKVVKVEDNLVHQKIKVKEAIEIKL